MKKILIVTASVPRSSDDARWFAFRDDLRSRLGGVAFVDMTSLTSLVFDISNDVCSVIDQLNGGDVASYDLVVIRNVGQNLELGITLAHYLSMKKVPFTDSYLEVQGSGKLAGAMSCRKFNLPIPHTVYGSARNLAKYITDTNSLQFPIILKADIAKKGRDNYLIQDADELASKLSAQPEVAFIAQEFIANDGDYRALVLDGQITTVIKRVSSGDSHLNNTSQGGEAILQDAEIFNDQVKADIIKSAKIDNLEVAGVDIVFDKKTNQHYILEVNRAPQISTGTYVDEKVSAFAEMILHQVGCDEN